ncbi:heat shock 70 kDa protein 12A-like isoform X3 [Biomphalaria glabrata]|nr:heat shock 70 kDa protein 12A-like isoform X3 [Biomphalaria glabrata]XP_055895611.1 heat shock 70 kDa protein 12A-like isoform X3 [Biomphalaria glabrata]KAI8761497.1 C-type lectin domain family 4 member E [Biomphalaria glabrata]KAK0043022.1 C-type lectin domain family 4 member E [Biomphalaria pfeifferi]
MAETSVTIRKDSPRKKKSHSSMSASFSECQSPASDAGMTMASSRIDNDGEEAADYQIVAAIDFGTTFSGYAYSFASNKQAIHVNKNWGQTQGFLLHKTPTCLLLKSDGQFEAFGFEAVSKYNELCEDEACSYYYFDRFKMKLYNNKELSTDITITDANGKSQPAVDVFAHSLTFMKKHLLRAIGAHLGYDPHPDTVRWVLTVPAIWDENAKQFMREAAHKGGLIDKPNSEQLVIALEPEAASLHCRNLPATDFVGYKDSTLSKPSFEPGTKYLVVDAGGGTIDCVAHKIRKDGRIRELFRATGGAWGGTIIDKQFQSLLESIFGVEFIAAFMKEYPKDFVELLQDFEIKKRGECDSIRVSLPYNFCNYKHNGVSVQQAIKRFSSEQGSSDIKFSSGKLVLSSTQVNILFKDALDQINDHVQTLLHKPKCKDLHNIFLVGGFAESQRLQSSLREKFGERVTILVPEEASLSVVKGAVAFGHDPSAICQRICRFTYGVGSYLPFEEGVHRDDLRVNSDGMDLCKHIFQTWAEAGEVIGHNEIWRETYTPIINNQKGIIFEFFRSSSKKVQYTDEPGVEKCGFLVVEMPDPTGGRDRAVDLEVIFGGTEIKVVGYDHTSTTRHETYIDFLST